MIPIKTNSEMKVMREANRIIAVILAEISRRIRPGVTTLELDLWAEQRINELGAKPGFKGYRASSRLVPYPATLCTSVNHEVVHGIPSSDKVLKEGDIIGIDVGAYYRNFYGDGAWTYPVGPISEPAQSLLDVCRRSLDIGIEQASTANRVSDISIAIDRFVRPHGFEIVRDLSGHGIGRNLHEEPQVLNYDNGFKGPRLKKNMTIAIEPMITAGGYEIRSLEDQWTVVTVDGSLSAHFEHTVAVTDNGPEILTRL